MQGLGVPFASGQDEGWTFINLAREDLPLRLRLAEILLAPDKGMMQQRFYESIAELCFRIMEMPSDEQKDPGDARYRLLRIQVLEAFGLRTPDLRPEKVDMVMQCVMHVLSKRIIDGNIARFGLTVRDRVYGGIRLRRDFHLPDLPIPNSMLYGVLEPVYHPSRGHVGRQPGDEVSSLDTPMVDPVDTHSKRTTGPTLEGDRSTHYHTPRSP
ncbi:hypothetical protein LTR85_005791 [Meristemomyces frigidus]|nr:hypothetical protein LTR85_005791 [Meristemomyces frigidus]